MKTEIFKRFRKSLPMKYLANCLSRIRALGTSSSNARNTATDTGGIRSSLVRDFMGRAVAFFMWATAPICFAQLTDLDIVHGWWQADPRYPGEERATLNTHVWGHNSNWETGQATQATTFRIYWARGPSLANKISLIHSETVPSIASGEQYDRDDTLIPASSLIPPAGATWVILVIDEDNRVAEMDEGNNMKSFPLALDMRIERMEAIDGAIRVSYRQEPASFEMQWVPTQPTTAKLFWAKGPTLADRTSEFAIYTHVISGPLWCGAMTDVLIEAGQFKNPPIGTTCILVALDPYEVIVDPNRTNNFQTISIMTDLRVERMESNQEGLLFTYQCDPVSMMNQWTPIRDTTAKLFWSRGPNLADRTSEIPIYTHSIQGPILRNSRTDVQVDDEALVFYPPQGATCILLVLDPDEVVADPDRTNNLQTYSIELDLAVEDISSTNDGLHFSYSMTRAADDWHWSPWTPMRDTRATLFWAKGPTLADITSDIPIHTHYIEGPARWNESREVLVDASLFRNPPAGTTGVLVAMDMFESVPDPDRTNNFQLFANVIGEVTLITDTDPNIVQSPRRSPGGPIIVKGKVEVKRSGVWQELKKEDKLLPMDVIRTWKSSFVKLRFEDNSILSMGPESEVTITQSMLTGEGDRRTILELIKGEIRNSVTDQGDGGYDVHTKTVAMGVRGTEFDVEYREVNGVGTTILTVYEGIVEATDYATGEITQVGAGETFQASAAVPPPASIIGSWFLSDGNGGRSVVTFMANGEYMFFKDGDSVADPGGQDGMERGTYDWDAEVGVLSATVLADTNGEWGLSYGLALQPSLAATVGETTLSLTIPFKGTSTYSRVGSPTSPLMGSWYVGGGTLAGGVATVTFLEDGSYYFMQDGDSNMDPTGTDGGERGTFTWDAASGAFSATPVVDTCGAWGLSGLDASPSVVLKNNNTMVLNDTNLSGSLTFYRIRPFDGTFEGWKAKNALFGADAEPDAKPFADGIANLMRYALNLENSFPPPGNLPIGQVVEISGNRNLTLEFRVRKNLRDATLTPQVSTTLENWSPVPAEFIHRLADDDSDTSRYIVRMPVTGPRAFLRLAGALAPDAPARLAASAGNAQVVLSWPSAVGATGYQVKRSLTSGSGYVTIQSLSKTTCTDDTAVNGTTYYYVVSATNSVGEGADSVQVRATPMGDVATFDPPSGFYADGISVTITADAGATVYYTTDGSDPVTSPTRFSGTSPVTGIAVPAGMSMTLNACAFRNSFLCNPLGTAFYNIATWSNPAGGSWPIPGNWLNGNVGQGTDMVADFSTLELTADATVTLDGALTIGGLKFGDTTPSHNWWLATGTGGPLTLQVTSGSPLIHVANQAATIGTALAGTVGLAKSGAGQLALTSANTYTGPTIVSRGLLTIGNNTAAGSIAGTSPASVTTDATLQWYRSDTSQVAIANMFDGTGTVSLAGAGTADMASQYNLTADNTAFAGTWCLNGGRLNVATAAQLGDGAVHVHANGQLFASGNITLANPITITDSSGWRDSGKRLGAVRMESNSSLTGNLVLSQTTGIVNGDTTGRNATLCGYAAGTHAISGVISGTGELSMSRYTSWYGGSPKTVNFDLTGTDSNTYSGRTVVDGQGGVASLRLMKTGGAIAIPGGTTVQLGSTTSGMANLRMGDTTATGADRSQWNNQFGTANGGVVLSFVNASGQWMDFDLQGTNQTLAGLNAGTASTQGGAVIQNQNLQGFDPGQDATLTLIGSGAYLYNGYLRDQNNGGATRVLNLVWDGSGTQTLAGGANSYSGTTTVSNGTLLINGLLANSATTVAAAGTLGGTGTLAATVTNNGTLAPGSNAVGNLTVNNTLTLAPGSKVAWEISDWSGTAGTGWDKATVTTLNLTATSANRITIKPADPTLSNFTETSKTFVLIQTTSGITGFSADKFTVDTTGLTTPQGTWAVQQSGNDLVLAYTSYNTAPGFATTTPRIQGAEGNPDANGNGIPDAWETEHFGNSDPGAHPPDADPDGDGLPNLMEFALDTDPVTANASPLIHDFPAFADGNHLRLTVPKNPVATNLTYTVETCGTLNDWSATDTVVEADTETKLTVRDAFATSTAPRRFIRLRVTVIK